MKFALSNIAFKPDEKETIYALMKTYGFTGLEIAPSLFLDGSKKPYDEEKKILNKAEKQAHKYNLNLISMQALLFGSSELFLFKNEETRKNLMYYCKKAVDFAKLLKIPNLVFGSPKNRTIPNDMSKKNAIHIAIHFFKELGDYAANHNTCIAMEANASAYSGNFITQTLQAVDLIEKVQSRGFKLNLDMGTMSLENESNHIIPDIMPYINHIHISAKFLDPIYEDIAEIHQERAELIKSNHYNKYISIEMKALNQKNNTAHIEKALMFVNKNYR